jgi:type I restriction enzyme, S subunit
VKKWQTHCLGDLVKAGGGSIQTGPFGSQLHASDYVLEGIPCIMPANLKNNRVDVSGIARISEHDAKRLNRHIVQAGDIVYSRRGDVTQKALITESENGFFCGTGCLLMRPGTKIDPAFLTYYLSTATYQSWIASQAVGATMPNLNTGILHRVSFCAPEKSEQKRITAALTALDAKIELNNRINEELEAMAKLLYDYWFVQFDFPITAAQAAAMGKPRLEGKPYRASGGKMIYNDALKREIPDGWLSGNLESLGKIVGGSTPSTEISGYFCQRGTPWITPKDMSNSTGNRFIDRGSIDVTSEGINAASLKILPAGTVLMSSRAPIGYLAVARNAVTTNQGLKSIVPGNGFSTDYIYFTLNHFMGLIKANASGSTFKEISGGTLKAVQIHLPPGDLVTKFTEYASCLSSQQSLLEQQNQQLTELRDWLLPMLMNGQVTVA